MFEWEQEREYWIAKFNRNWFYDITATVNKGESWWWFSVDFEDDNVIYSYSFYSFLPIWFRKEFAEAMMLHFDPKQWVKVDNEDYNFEEYKSGMSFLSKKQNKNIYEKNVDVDIYPKYSYVKSHFKDSSDCFTVFYWKTIKKIPLLEKNELRKIAEKEWINFVDIPQLSCYFEKIKLLDKILQSKIKDTGYEEYEQEKQKNKLEFWLMMKDCIENISKENYQYKDIDTSTQSELLEKIKTKEKESQYIDKIYEYLINHNGDINTEDLAVLLWLSENETERLFLETCKKYWLKATPKHSILQKITNYFRI